MAARADKASVAPQRLFDMWWMLITRSQTAPLSLPPTLPHNCPASLLDIQRSQGLVGSMTIAKSIVSSSAPIPLHRRSKLAVIAILHNVIGLPMSGTDTK